MNIYPSPIACEPLAQAALTVKFIPRRWKMVLMFIFTVEFIDWNIHPEPSNDESFFSSIIFSDSTTAFADESFPNNTPISFSSMYSSEIPAFANASRLAIYAYSASSESPTRSLLSRMPFKTGRSTIPVRADW